MNDCITSSIDHVENSSSLSNIGLSLLNVNINLKIKKKWKSQARLLQPIPHRSPPASSFIAGLGWKRLLVGSDQL